MIAYLDLAGGLAGDMFISACLEAGLAEAELIGVLKKLPLGRWTLEQEPAQVFGLAARRIRFATEPSPPHRHYAQIRDEIIAPAELPERTKRLALAALAALAEAEAKVHGLEVDRVHFHEVGADDSILDLVGAAACLELLGVERFIASPAPLSRGVGRSQHGRLPLPAPATLELLAGKPVYGADSPTELITPTGAAILTWADDFGPLPAMELASVGVALGSREPQTGLTRLFLGREVKLAPGEHREAVTVLTTTIDDSSPELIAPLMDALLARGALDVTFMPIQMKKNRPGVRLEVLASPGRVEELAGFILEETTTLGIRIRTENRACLERRSGRVEVEGRSVAGKWVKRPSGRWEFRPEFEAVREAAEDMGRPVGLIYAMAQAAALGKEP